MHIYGNFYYYYYYVKLIWGKHLAVSVQLEEHVFSSISPALLRLGGRGRMLTQFCLLCDGVWWLQPSLLALSCRLTALWWRLTLITVSEAETLQRMNESNPSVMQCRWFTGPTLQGRCRPLKKIKYIFMSILKPFKSFHTVIDCTEGYSHIDHLKHPDLHLKNFSQYSFPVCQTNVCDRI